MDRPHINFQLHEVLPGGEVTGRNCGGDLLVGISFVRLQRRDYPESRLPGDVVASPEPVHVSWPRFRVEAVEWYGRNVELLPSGHTGKLTLSGVDFGAMADLVRTAPPHVSYSLFAPVYCEVELLSNAQLRKLCEMVHHSFVELRHLARSGECEQAEHLADAFHNLPNDVWRSPFSLRGFRDRRLEPFQKKYPRQGQWDYVARVNEIIAMRD